MKRGFTLVELSIVLVIIGLLIGGIIAAQSMIKTTKVQSFVRMVQQYDIGVSNFKTNFNQLPGDSTFFTPNGNNNGIIGSDTTTGCGYSSCFEYDNFWKHLSDSGMIKDTYNGDYSGGTFKPGINVPKGIIAEMLVGGGYNLTESAQVPAGHYYSTNASTDPTLLPTSADAIAVDTKIDDGAPTTGNVKTWKPINPGAGNPCTTTMANCQLIIALGIGNAAAK